MGTCMGPWPVSPANLLERSVVMPPGVTGRNRGEFCNPFEKPVAERLQGHAEFGFTGEEEHKPGDDETQK